MGHIRKHKTGIALTKKKLEYLILAFLDEKEADMLADFRPDSEIWRKGLAAALATYILKKNHERI